MIEREKVESALRDAIEAASSGNLGRAVEVAMGVADAFVWTQDGLKKRIDQLTAERKEQEEHFEYAIERSNGYLYGLNEAIKELEASKSEVERLTAENEAMRKQFEEIAPDLYEACTLAEKQLQTPPSDELEATYRPYREASIERAKKFSEQKLEEFGYPLEDDMIHEDINCGTFVTDLGPRPPTLCERCAGEAGDAFMVDGEIWKRDRAERDLLRKMIQDEHEEHQRDCCCPICSWVLGVRRAVLL